MLNAVVGDFGTGKTLYLSMAGVSSKYDILGNFTLLLDNYTKIDPIDLQNFGFQKTILLDELYLWLDSRVSSSYRNRFITYILLQCRHRDIEVYGSLQMFMTADVRFRDMVNRIIYCSRKYKSGIEREFQDFRFEELNTYNGKEKRWTLSYEKAKPYFEIFNTKEIMEAEDQAHLDLEMLKKYPRKLYFRLSEIAKEIREKVRKITHDSVKMSLLKEGYDMTWEGLVYSRIMDFEIQKEN